MIIIRKIYILKEVGNYFLLKHQKVTAKYFYGQFLMDNIYIHYMAIYIISTLIKEKEILFVC